jgi:hypothetical protein
MNFNKAAIFSLIYFKHYKWKRNLNSRSLLIFFTLFFYTGTSTSEGHSQSSNYINTLDLNGEILNIKIIKNHFIMLELSDQSNKMVYSNKFLCPTSTDLNYEMHKVSGKLYFTTIGRLKDYKTINSTSCLFLEDSQIVVIPAFKTDELTYVAYNKYGTDIILLKGIWSKDTTESHFSNHRYEIIKYIFKDDSFQQIKMGRTKFKYASFDDNAKALELISDIEIEEPLLLNSIKAREYKQ